jgi:hypothetical protein
LRATAREIIAGLKIIPAEERRAMAALVSAKWIAGLCSMPAKERAIVAKPSATVELRFSCKSSAMSKPDQKAVFLNVLMKA